MNPYTNSTKVSRTKRRQPAEQRKLIEVSNATSFPEDDPITRKVPAIIDISNDGSSPDQAPAPNEGTAWEQRPVWSLEVGENIIRVLPPYDEKGYVYEKIPHHWGVGPNGRGVICRRYAGKRCFICEMIEQLWRSGSAADWELAQRMDPDLRYFYNVIDVKNPARGILVWGTSEAMTWKLLPWFDPQSTNATDPKHGRNITILKAGEGQNSRYSEPQLASKPSPIAYDRWMKEIKHLDQYLRIPSWEEQRRIFEGR
jgi:hypothetical protein